MTNQPKVIELLKEAAAAGNSTAFFKDEDKLYVRFDEIVVRAKISPQKGILGTDKYEKNRYVIEIKLNGETLKEINLNPHINFILGDTLHLKKIDGVYEYIVEDTGELK